MDNKQDSEQQKQQKQQAQDQQSQHQHHHQVQATTNQQTQQLTNNNNNNNGGNRSSHRSNNNNGGHRSNNNNNNQQQQQQQQGQWQSFGSREHSDDNQQHQQQDSRDQQSSQLQSALQQALDQLQHNIDMQQPQGQSGQQPEDHDEQQSQPIPLPPAEEEQTLGCLHYLRNCEVEAPCCKTYYTCKLCHDEKYEGPKSKGCKVQRMAFDEVQHIKCLVCHTQQEPSLKCINPQCEITFGKYACLKCKLYENRSTKVNDIFHCDQCKMCRRGKKENFFHCHTCGYCRAISEKGKHKCTENVAESSCPICLQVLKYSTKHYYALPCGHLIHVQCAASYTSINCPVCGMAMQKLSGSRNKQIEQMIEQTKANMPKQLADKKVSILCNQCLHKSMDVQFHFFGMKCQKCGTFNTKMI